MLCSPDGDIDFFNIVTGVLQGDTLVSYLFNTLSRIYTMKVYSSNKKKFKKIKKIK